MKVKPVLLALFSMSPCMIWGLAVPDTHIVELVGNTTASLFERDESTWEVTSYTAFAEKASGGYRCAETELKRVQSTLEKASCKLLTPREDRPYACLELKVNAPFVECKFTLKNRNEIEDAAGGCSGLDPPESETVKAGETGVAINDSEGRANAIAVSCEK